MQGAFAVLLKDMATLRASGYGRSRTQLLMALTLILFVSGLSAAAVAKGKSSERLGSTLLRGRQYQVTLMGTTHQAVHRAKHSRELAEIERKLITATTQDYPGACPNNKNLPGDGC